ncbi:MAG: exopolyphosphatase/guanosine-5'-triphosphate,3'-diphosphate pyrophosphatase, partial [Myxococcota bacterium]
MATGNSNSGDGSRSDTSGAPELVAAVDLGSNSFHLAIARVVDGALFQVDKVKERVHLADGLRADKTLDDAAQVRALDCLELFGQRLRDTPPKLIRAVGTDTFRAARNAREFVDKASLALGHPIEVISGDEEARLVYRGVVHELPHHDGLQQLVIDIGGGSTEVILGVGLDPTHTTSLHLGCVRFTNQFFADGHLTPQAFDRAVVAAQLEFERLRGPYFKGDWARTVGSSGTINAIQEVLRENNWSTELITKEGLYAFRDAIIAQGRVETLAIKGLTSSRVGVISGGLAVLIAAFETLPLQKLEAVSGALREGVLYDLVGRARNQDVRDSTIQILMDRFRVDTEHATRVETTALQCLMMSNWFEGADARTASRYLSWAARLHEVGLALSFHGYHKHGAYIVGNSTMPGFSTDDQQLLSMLVLTHRRKTVREGFDQLPAQLRVMAKRLMVFLRIAVRLNRNRSWRPPTDIILTTKENTVTVDFPAGHLSANPLTAA